MNGCSHGIDGIVREMVLDETDQHDQSKYEKPKALDHLETLSFLFCASVAHATEGASRRGWGSKVQGVGFMGEPPGGPRSGLGRPQAESRGDHQSDGRRPASPLHVARPKALAFL